jgi:hypothetical protein
MTLRAVACAFFVPWVVCAGCHQAPKAPPPQEAAPPASAQLAPVVESPKFVLESPTTFFTKPTSDDLLRVR